jgi:hypothetical protein
VFKELNLPRNMAATKESFYPLSWDETFKLWLPEFRQEVEERTRNAIFLPLYQSFPRYVGFDPYMAPPKGSYLGNFLEEFLPGIECSEHDAQNIRNLTGTWLRANSWAVDRLQSAGCCDLWRELL